MNEIILSLNKLFIIEYEWIYIGCSIGGVEYLINSGNLSEIICMVDEVLYELKCLGKNKMIFYVDLNKD